MFRFLREMINTILGGREDLLDTGYHRNDPKNALENLLRIMYGRGEISREVYRQLRLRLHWNQIGKGDLILLHEGYLRKLAAQGRILEVENREARRLLDRLYLDRVLMEEAVENVANRQKALAAELDWLHQQAESARNSAQSALPDESLARIYLEVWQDLQALASELMERQQALEQQHHRIEAQSAELKAAITKLKLIQSQERLAELNLRIRQDLLPQGKKSI
jgi:hypothetical protein